MYRLAILALSLVVAGCVSTKPTEAELAVAKQAKRPLNAERAQAEIKTALASRQITPQAARYEFLAPTNSVYVLARGQERQVFAGWFVCGLWEAPTPFGGPTGKKPFMAYFDPETGFLKTTFAESNFDTLDACNEVYGEKVMQGFRRRV